MKRNLLHYGFFLLALALCLCFGIACSAETLPAEAADLLPDTTVTADITGGELTWFRFVPEETALYTFYSSSDTDTYAYLYQKNGEEIDQITYDDDSGNGNNFDIKRTLTAGEEYYFGVRFYSRDRSGSFPVTIEKFTGLTMTYKDTSYYRINIGETATLEVEASSGKGEVTFLWAMRDENYLYQVLEGENGASITVTAASKQQEYKCQATDGVTTLTLNFTVYGDDPVTIQADGETSFQVTPGGSAEMKVQATSASGTVTYQWNKYWVENGYSHYEVIEGANTSSYTAENITGDCEYYCTAKSTAGGEQSIWFYIYLDAPVTVTAVGETYRYVDLGGSTEMAVTASTPAGSLSYQWYYYDEDAGQNRIIENATSASYTAEDIRRRTTYYCYVENEYGTQSNCSFNINLNGDYSAYAYSSHIWATPGESIQLEVYAYGDNMTYQWYGPVSSKQETPALIEGQNESTFTLENASANGYYLCHTANGAGIEKDIWIQIEIESDLDLESWSDYVYGNANEETTLSVTAYSSAGDVTYQWYIQDPDNASFEKAHLIEGATSAEYTITNPTRYNTTYYCVVTDIYGNTVTATRWVQISGTLSVETIGDTYQQVAPGGSATFAVRATGDGEITYQWRVRTAEHDYQDIPGATSDTCTFENVRERMEITCRVSTSFTNSTSCNFNLSIDNNLQVTNAGSVYAAPNEPATLSVQATCTTGAISYQWYIQERDIFNNTATVKIPGATASTYTTEPVTQQKYYSCTVTDEYGNSTSTGMYVYVDNKLTVQAVGNTSITVEPGNTTVLQVSASVLSGEIHYQWSKSYTDENGIYHNETIEGATENTYTTEEINRRMSFSCRVTDDYGNSSSAGFTIRINNNFSANAAGQSSFRVEPGETATLEINATVTAGEIHYQWYKEYKHPDGYWTDTIITGATEATYTTEAFNDRANYYCYVSDDYGNSNSVWFYISIENHFSASADGESSFTVEPGEAATLKVNATATAGEIHYEWHKYYRDADNSWYDTVIEGATDAEYTTEAIQQYTDYYCYVTDDYGNYNNVWFNIGIENHFSAEAAGETSLTVEPGETVTLEINATADTGEIHYQWYKQYRTPQGYWNTTSISGATEAIYTTEAINDRISYYCDVTDDYGNNDNISFSITIDNHFSADADGETSFTVEPGETATMKINATVLAGKIHYQWYKQERDSNGSWYNTILDGVTAAEYTTEAIDRSIRYYCVVNDDYGNSQNVWFYINIENHFSAEADGENRFTVEPGETATLKVNATATTGEIHYQWYKRYRNADNNWNTTRIDGATGAEYTTEAIDRYYEYYCTVADDFNNSNNVWFYIGIENHFSAQPDGETEFTVEPGQTATLKIYATAATGEIHYQWYKEYRDSNNNWHTTTLDGATAAEYTTEAIEQYTQYYCYVSDDYGTTNDIWFYISIENHFSAQPDGQTEFNVEPGETTTLKINATAATGEIHYQWYKEYRGSNNNWYSTILNGATAAEYTTEAINQYTRYYCRVTDDYGNTDNVWFYIGIENSFSARADGETNFTVEPGGTATLKVTATATAGEIHYQWYREYSDANGSWHTTTITGATEATLTTEAIDRFYEYYCRVSDDYGNYNNIWFYIGIENHFSAEADGETDFTVEPGETVTLKVSASAATGELHYQWYTERKNDNGSWTSERINGATSAEYSTDAINRYVGYYCRVTDDFGNNNDVWFYISIENHFTARAEGQTNFTVEPGESVTLKVSATADAGGFHYLWYREYRNPNGYWNRTVIPGATEAEYTIETVEQYSQYYCYVSDDYGNNEEIWFHISIENGLTASAISSTSFTVEPGESVTMEVLGTANTGAIRYQWYEETRRSDGYWYDSIISGATEASYTTAAIYEYKQYYCYVTDDYGNNRNIWFHVGIENGLTARAAGDDSFTIVPGESATLEVTASANTGDIHYQWYVEYREGNSWHRNRITGETSEKYTTPEMSKSRNYICLVTDDFGNEREIWFEVYIENHLTISAVSDRNFVVEKGADVTMAAEATADSGPIHYQWYYEYRINANEWTYEAIPGATAASYELKNIQKSGEYYCEAEDMYGNTVSTYFNVTLDNQLTVSSDQTAVVIVSRGGSLILSVTATCAEGELRYDWTSNDNMIPGATKAFLMLDNINENKQITCAVTDIYDNTRYVNTMVLVGEDITALELDREYSAEISTYGGFRVYSFIPDVTGIYTVESQNPDDGAYITLYDAEWNRRTSNGNNNISLVTQLIESNQYYFVISSRYYDVTGRIPLHIELTSIGAESLITLQYGQSAKLPADAVNGEIRSISTTNSIVSISGDILTTMYTGEGILRIEYENDQTILCPFEVLSSPAVLKLPDALTTIEEGAFDGNQAARIVELGAGVTEVEKDAFANSGLRQVLITSPATTLDAGAFGSIRPTIICPAGSRAETFAKQNGYLYLLLQ